MVGGASRAVERVMGKKEADPVSGGSIQVSSRLIINIDLIIN